LGDFGDLGKLPGLSCRSPQEKGERKLKGEKSHLRREGNHCVVNRREQHSKNYPKELPQEIFEIHRGGIPGGWGYSLVKRGTLEVLELFGGHFM